MIGTESTSTATPDRLWELVSDLPRWAELLPTVTDVRVLQPGPVAVGSRFEVRQPGLATAVYEVTDWQPSRTFTWAATAPGVRTTAVHTVHADGDGSRLELTLDWSGPLAGLIRLLYRRKAMAMIETEAQTFTRLADRPLTDRP